MLIGVVGSLRIGNWSVGGSPQSGAVATMTGIKFVPIFQLRQPRFYIFEFRSIQFVFGLGGQQSVDLALSSRDSIGSLRMSIEGFGKSTRLLFLHCLHFFEE